MSTDCVPLCAADRAYGVRAPWWKHEAQCPARRARHPEPPCRTCDGTRLADRGFYYGGEMTCPDCTPENVEDPA